MTTTPDPQTVREIAQDALTIAIRRGAVEAVEAALIASGAAGPVVGEKFDEWTEAIAAEYLRLAAALSWPDEQPQDERCSYEAKLDVCVCGDPDCMPYWRPVHEHMNTLRLKSDMAAADFTKAMLAEICELRAELEKREAGRDGDVREGGRAGSGHVERVKAFLEGRERSARSENGPRSANGVLVSRWTDDTPDLTDADLRALLTDAEQPQDERDARIAELEREVRQLRAGAPRAWKQDLRSPVGRFENFVNATRNYDSDHLGGIMRGGNAEATITLGDLRAVLARLAELETAQDERDGDVRAVALLATVSGVCICSKCEATGRSIYRMVGKCWNCGAEPILMLFRAGDRTGPLDCPLCGCKEVRSSRRATDDEIPAAAEDAALEARDVKGGE